MPGELPQDGGGDGLLIGGGLARVRLLDGSRGSARVKLSVGTKAVFDQVLTPEGKAPVAVSFEVPVGSGLKLEVDFGKRVRFPCGITLDNALLVKK